MRVRMKLELNKQKNLQMSHLALTKEEIIIPALTSPNHNNQSQLGEREYQQRSKGLSNQERL